MYGVFDGKPFQNIQIEIAIKTTNTEGRSVVSIQIQKDATFKLDRKQINLIPNKSFRYYKQWSSIIFRRIRK